MDIKTYGVYNPFSTLLAQEIESLKAVFREDVAERLLTFAMMRWVYQSPIKRVSNYHAHDFCPEHWGLNAFSDKHLSKALKFVVFPGIGIV